MRPAARSTTRAVAAVAVPVLLGAAGCATTSADGDGGGTTGARRPAATVGTTVPPEKFEEIDNFFRSKASQLQFTCYNPEVERTGKKYQGFVSLLVSIIPGGKAEEVKMISSSLKSPGIEQCILEQARGWQWPDVPARVPYNGSLGFKPAW